VSRWGHPRPAWYQWATVLMLVGLLLSSCSPSSPSAAVREITPSLTASPEATLAPPDAQQPAAGICADLLGELVTLEISPDVPSPRCARVTADQHLEVVNHTQVVIVVRLAGYEAQLEPGGAFRIEAPLGSYLETGVHWLKIEDHAANAPELWLIEEP